MTLVKSVSGLTLPGTYTLEVQPQVIIQGIGVSGIALLGTASRGSIYATAPYASYDQDFINNYGGIFASGNKTNTLNYATLGLGMVGIARQGGGQVYPIRIGSSGSVAAASVTVPSTGGNFTVEARTPGTWANNMTIVVLDDVVDPLRKQIQITSATAEEELFTFVDNWVDELNSKSNLVKIVTQTGTDILPTNSVLVSGVPTPYTLAGGTNGTTIGSATPYADFIGEIDSQGRTTGLQLVESLSDIRFIVMSEHYVTLGNEVSGNFVPSPTGTLLDPATVEAIRVANQIQAIVILAANDNLTYSELKLLAKNSGLKATDRVILTYPKMKVFEQTYKNIIDVSSAPYYAGMWAGYAPNQSPSNKPLIGVLGPTKRITRSQAADFSSIATGISAIGVIPIGGLGPINGQNTSSNGGLNQSLRRRMADFILLSLDRNLGDLVSALNTPTLRTSTSLRINQFFASLQAQGLIGDSAGGSAYSVTISDANNPRSEIAQRRLNISIVVSLFTPADFIIVKGTIGFDGINITAS